MTAKSITLTPNPADNKKTFLANEPVVENVPSTLDKSARVEVKGRPGDRFEFARRDRNNGHTRVTMYQITDQTTNELTNKPNNQPYNQPTAKLQKFIRPWAPHITLHPH